MRHPSSLVLLLVAALSLAACGRDEAGPSFAPEPGVPGKPNPALGAVTCAIVDRPAPDRAVVEATWTLGDGAQGCALELVLPEGALLVAGDGSLAVDTPAAGEPVRWTVEFPPAGREPLDAVVRLCGAIERGPRVVEAIVRLRPGR